MNNFNILIKISLAFSLLQNIPALSYPSIKSIAAPCFGISCIESDSFENYVVLTQSKPQTNDDDSFFVYDLSSNNPIQFSYDVLYLLFQENNYKNIHNAEISELLEKRLKIINSEDLKMSDLFMNLVIVSEMTHKEILQAPLAVTLSSPYEENQFKLNELKNINRILAILKTYLTMTIIYDIFGIDNTSYESLSRDNKFEVLENHNKLKNLFTAFILERSEENKIKIYKFLRKIRKKQAEKN
ncbi:hypothetical protein [Fluviispira sanaruensis]|uniref:Uncharacterized protein n=1 Tax=Fluviispira sanaruensis TaxID=2493639 RepID=A0A4P2VQG1_FLUSA|nr:hypothetical protein [Fluviispira sanaruensis]BBH54524.1 hypothetical protein JCM31447_29950 [Fluviispira sanaruensis]